MEQLKSLRYAANLITGIGMGGRAAAYILFFAARHLFLPFAIFGAAFMIGGAGMYAGGLAGYNKLHAAETSADKD
jgi:hypothetical protein